MVKNPEQTLTPAEVSNLALQLRNSRSYLTFQNRKNRDAVARECKAHRISVSKGSIRGQLLDPRYTVEGSNLPDKGLGNDYRHYHSVLYKLESTSW